MTDPSPILSRLSAMQDVQYRDFQCKLIPNVPSDLFIGIRTPDLRKYARELYKEEKDPASGSIRQDSFLEAFLEDLPHRYFDENQLHAFVISEEKISMSASRGLNVFCPLWTTGPPATSFPRKCSKRTGMLCCPA